MALTLKSDPCNHYRSWSDKTDFMATESTEEHGNIFIRHLFFRVLPWIPWLMVVFFTEYK